MKTLSPGRWILLKKLRKKGPMSIRALAKELNRDYKNVHTDVRTLERVGLIEATDKKNHGSLGCCGCKFAKGRLNTETYRHYLGVFQKQD